MAFAAMAPAPSSCITRSAGNSLRAAVVARAVAAPPRHKPSVVPEVLDGGPGQRSANFLEYKQATQMLDRLNSQASDLEQLLDQLNALEAGLDDTLLTPPPAAPDDPAQRRAQRAAKRAERKNKGGAGPAVARDAAPPAASLALDAATLAGPSPSPAASAPSAAPSTASTDQPVTPLARSSSVSSVQQLEELFKLTVGEPDLPTAVASSTIASTAAPVLRPRKPARKAAAPPAADPAAAPAAAPSSSAPAPAAAAAAAAAAPSAPAPAPVAPPAESLVQRLQRLLEPHDSVDPDEALASYAGPSDEDLHALEQEQQQQQLTPEALASQHGAAAAAAAAQPQLLLHAQQHGLEDARALDVSAQATRGADQLSVMPAGPSLPALPLPLPGFTAGAAGASARARQARRSARHGHAPAAAFSDDAAAVGGARGARSLARDGTAHFLAASSAVNNLDVEREREVMEVCRDYLFLEKVKRQCAMTLHREATTGEMAAAVGMDVMSYKLRYDAGLKAKEVLLKSNYKLILTICKKYVNAGGSVQVQDLVSEGVRGLLRSVEGYDASKGFRFGTYAHWWIRQAISRSMAETGRAIRLPVHMIEQLTKLRNVTAHFQSQHNREPEAGELADAMGLPVARIEVLLESARSAVSLDQPAPGSDAPGSLKDAVEDDRTAADEEFGASQLRTDIESMLGELSEREARVVRLRFGLEDGVEWTLEDIGDALEVTRERIRQIEAKALRKLQMRTIDVAGKLKDYSDNMDMLEAREVAGRSSLSTRKT